MELARNGNRVGIERKKLEKMVSSPRKKKCTKSYVNQAKVKDELNMLLQPLLMTTIASSFTFPGAKSRPRCRKKIHDLKVTNCNIIQSNYVYLKANLLEQAANVGVIDEMPE